MNYIFGVLFGGLLLGVAAVYVDKVATTRTIRNITNSCEKYEVYFDNGVAMMCSVKKTTML
jgi:hypothetical protein